MSSFKPRFSKGIAVIPVDLTSEDLVRKGEIAYDSSDDRLKYKNDEEISAQEDSTNDLLIITNNSLEDDDKVVYEGTEYFVVNKLQNSVQLSTTLGGSAIDITTDSVVNITLKKTKVFVDTQTAAVIENKTIDATSATGNNTLSADASDIVYDDTVNTDRVFGTNVQDALDAAKAQLEGQDQAIEITYDNTSSELTATNVQAAIDEVEARVDQNETEISEIDQNVDDLVTLSGVAENSTDLGTFTGVTITDNVTVKNALQEVETQLDTNTTDLAETDQNTDDLVTLSGVAENSTDLGTFTGTTITDNTTVKNALQEVETQVDTNTTDISTTQSDITEIDQNVDDLVTLSGVAENSTNLGTFTGVTITDNTTVKAALQEVETQLDTNTTDLSETDQNTDDLVTLSGVAENSTNLGTFTGVTITDNVTVKAALQEVETKLETNESNIAETDQNTDDLVTLSGVAENSTNLGVFTGTTITDNTTVKAALQEVETQLDSNTSNISTAQSDLAETDQNTDDLVTLSGVAENSTDLGVFTGTTITDNTTVKAALQEIETQVDTNESNISTAQSDIAETDQNTDDLITLSGVAENSTDLGTFTGTTITDNTTVKNALQELETAVAGAGSDKVDKVNPSTDHAIVRFDGVTGDQQDSGVSISDTNDVTGVNSLDTDLLTVDGITIDAFAISSTSSLGLNSAAGNEVIINDNSFLRGNVRIDSTTDGTSGSNVTLSTVTDQGIILTSGTLVSIDMIPNLGNSAYKLILFNRTGGSVTISNETGATSADQIITGTGSDLELADNAAIQLVYNTNAVKWQVVGGSGAGASGPETKTQSITNNQTTAANITDLLLDGSTYKGYKVTYNVYRVTDTNEVSETGTLLFAYKPNAGTWSFSENYAGDDSITFSVTGAGQVQYTTGDLTGTGYSGEINFTIDNKI